MVKVQFRIDDTCGKANIDLKLMILIININNILKCFPKLFLNPNYIQIHIIEPN
jgi:hypothetical protein